MPPTWSINHGGESDEMILSEMWNDEIFLGRSSGASDNILDSTSTVWRQLCLEQRRCSWRWDTRECLVSPRCCHCPSPGLASTLSTLTVWPVWPGTASWPVWSAHYYQRYDMAMMVVSNIVIVRCPMVRSWAVSLPGCAHPMVIPWPLITTLCSWSSPPSSPQPSSSSPRCSCFSPSSFTP